MKDIFYKKCFYKSLSATLMCLILKLCGGGGGGGGLNEAGDLYVE